MASLKTRRQLSLTFRYVVIIIFVIISLFPIYEMVSTSLKYPVDAFSIPPKWVFKPTLDNYKEVLVTNNFMKYFMNSIIVAFTATIFSVAAGTLAAYSLARFKFYGKKSIVVLTLIMRMIPPVILVVPVFLLYNNLGLTNGRIGLILVYIALNLPFNIWVLRTFVMEIPHELEESAVIDGCSDFMTFRKIVLPLIAPGIAVASIFTFRISWNEFILSLVLTNRNTRTLPVAVSLFLTDTGTEWGKITAVATIIAIPAFIFTFTAAKSLIMGLTAGAVKG
ncbi:MAG: carbohydrate ABC transporter permease [Spirochaetia bacterium]|nr:carbohydrate ABC transporter permease [Spirochaetia bacterium]MCF7953788.1 carbohydrate ABC transporter permease [Spirochaetales bacterium]